MQLWVMPSVAEHFSGARAGGVCCCGWWELLLAPGTLTEQCLVPALVVVLGAVLAEVIPVGMRR